VYLHGYDMSKKVACKSVAKTQRNITVCVKTLRFFTEVLTNLASRVNN